MMRAIRFFSLKQMSQQLHVGRKSPHTPLSVIQHELEQERLLMGEAVVSKRLDDEKVVLNMLKDQRAEYKKQVKRSVEELMENPLLNAQGFHALWKNQQNILTLYLPENKELLAETIDWLKARQILTVNNRPLEGSAESHAENFMEKCEP
jgi:hypothetical protein